MTARPSGTSAFRFTLPRDLVDSIAPGLPVMDNTKNAVIDVHLALDGSNRSIVKYPCRSYNLLNFVCIAPDSHIGAKTTESWSAQGSLEDLLATYHDYDQQTLSLIR